MERLNVEIHGADEIKRKLDALSDLKLAKKIASRSARKAMDIVRSAAVTNAKLIDDPETSEQISRNIALRSGRTRDRGAVRIRVGVKGGFEFWTIHKKMSRRDRATGKNERVSNPYYKQRMNNTQYWQHVEMGTQYSMAMPFLRPAFHKNIKVVTDTFVSEFMSGLTDELSKIR